MSERAAAARRSRRPYSSFQGDVVLVLLVVFLCVLWVAGGASREDAAGQFVVRAAAWGILVVALVFGRRPSPVGLWPILGLLGAAILLPLLQLIPLSPAVWQSLPGRALFVQAMRTGEPQPWRPLSLVPGATANAAASLVVPAVTLFLLAQLRAASRERLPVLVLALLVASVLLALLQFSTGGMDNPLINETVGQISGPFANRNHFALFMAMGCLLTPVWAFRHSRGMTWRAPFALGLVLLFMLTILGGGSRAGLLLGALGLCLGLGLVQRDIRRALRHFPRWVFPAALAGIVSVIAIVVLASVAANRAVSIDRMFVDGGMQDMRRRALPTILDMISDYFPAGSGLGSFDAVFRLHEPFDLLKLTYFNHAHNDFLEVVLDTGLAGALLLLGAMAWWLWASAHALLGNRRAALPQLGSAMLLLVFVASMFDYPARTPLIMAAVIIAATWLSAATSHRELGASSLPNRD